MTTVEILRKARAAIEDQEDWGQGFPPTGLCAHTAIRTVTRCGVEMVSLETATIGALCRVMAPGPDRVLQKYAEVWEFNDTHTHAEVLAAFDQAIANEEAREAEFDVPDEFVQAVKEIVNV